MVKSKEKYKEEILISLLPFIELMAQALFSRDQQIEDAAPQEVIKEVHKPKPRKRIANPEKKKDEKLESLFGHFGGASLFEGVEPLDIDMSSYQTEDAPSVGGGNGRAAAERAYEKSLDKEGEDISALFGAFSGIKF